MRFPPLVEGRLVRRYKRFLADIELNDGRQVTAHCPNTGSMKHCADPGSRVWLRDVASPGRKLPFRWELVEVDQRYLACINTGLANRLVSEAIEADAIPELAGYTELLTERPYGREGSRIDLLLRGGDRPDCFVEVKNVTLLEEEGWGAFPDAVSERGRKHLRELMEVVQGGSRGVLFFNVAHSGIRRVIPAWHIDPKYAETLALALESGVEVLAYGARIDSREIVLESRLPFCLREEKS
ncbi:MAG: DNA/RNA nuclease SfsA [Sedimenticola sp.]|nr:DNA/RNA nuclease SfsA [Sedimenticola sp.]